MHIQHEGAPLPGRRFRTGVSLHSHTNHSRESLSFIYRYAAEVPLLRSVLQREERRYRERHGGVALDLSRGWWTPPLGPHDAWNLERRQIEERYGLRSLVSLSDHDDIEAGMSLRVLSECRTAPVSVEWTVPWRRTFFHLGIHNLPPGEAREVMGELAAVTAAPTPGGIAATLDWVAGNAGTLVVFNHPCWDENRIGADEHRASAADFAAQYRPWLHAAELNGLRPWAENREAMRFASETGLPILSGGDRHALEPNVILNLTNATTFAEFVEEIKAGESCVFVTERYHESFRLRVLESIGEILEGRWTDRVYYLCDDGVTRSLTELFAAGAPAAVRVFTGGVRVLRQGVSFVRPFTPRPVIPRLPA